jgi:hypothetical protein
MDNNQSITGADSTPHSPRHGQRALPIMIGIAALVIVAAVLIAIIPGCASKGATTSASSNGTNNPQVTGCPGTKANVSWPQKPSVSLHAEQADTVTTVQQGQSIQFTFPSGSRWGLIANTTSQLSLEEPAGYYDAGSKTCGWRFMAKQSGTTTLEFSRQALCQSDAICPGVIIQYRFPIEVK